ncbi:hypothetical protein VII00023_00515 [Vibrio ichthyoenteri ATCC 700023]|uniref:DUF3487 family protein n=1 Tax=Vibrio ichthyoenteri ATCC 700023 TaxID=870968 RepID=F9S145_9VIBR|nr:DUF3487 family protein [Vibrio ichthyoenteri]EGU42405.1 hypothetical protein VII00023_00515 [Vibrio ichthyoenteri ATCC 700023]
MKSAACLNVMPPFYKGLSLGEIGVLTIVNTLILGVIGLFVAFITGWWIVFVSALLLGLLSMAILPKGLIAPLTRIKARHCQYYLQKQFDRRVNTERYTTQSRRFATRRT